MNMFEKGSEWRRWDLHVHTPETKKNDNYKILIVTHNANVVLGGDAEEIIVANQDGNNSPNAKFRFEYRSGSIENDTPILNLNGEKQGVLNEKGIQQHICDVLEGGERAFDLRKRKYRIQMQNKSYKMHIKKVVQTAPLF